MKGGTTICVLSKVQIAAKENRAAKILLRCILDKPETTERATGFEVIDQWLDGALDAKFAVVPGLYSVLLETRPNRGQMVSEVVDGELIARGFPSVE